MRRFSRLVCAAMLVMVASPAAAHPRDPFVPLIVPQTAADTTLTSEAGEPATAPGGESVDVVPARERLPATGRSLEAWLVIAYILTAAGAAGLFLARTFRPTPGGS